MHVELDFIFSLGLLATLLFQSFLPVLFRWRPVEHNIRLYSSFGVLGVVALLAGGVFFSTTSFGMAVTAILAVVLSWRLHAKVEKNFFGSRP